MQQFQAENESFDAFLQTKIDTFLYGDKDFIYKNDIEKVWKDYLVAKARSE
jgi:salicylate hydroxylase